MSGIKDIRFSNGRASLTVGHIPLPDEASMPTLLPLFLFVAASTLSPGGATSLATASGARFGLSRSLPLILGIATSLACIAAIAAIGLGNLIAEAPTLEWAVKVAGSAYLLWLAWRIARSGAPSHSTAQSEPLGFANAMALLLLNPKSWAMTVSAAATFSPLAAHPAGLAALLGLSFGIAAWLSLTLWCGLGVLLARWLRTPRHWQRFNLAMAALLVLSIVPTWS
jgi:threonine/homoserine/homoserine lactone efflux protein